MKKRILGSVLTAAGLIGLLMPSVESYAEILDDSTVGITYALDEYVASLNIKEIREEDVIVKDKKSTCKYPYFEGKCLANIEEAVDVYEQASETSTRKGSFPVNAIAKVVEKGKTWTKIESGITMGYVKNEYLLFGDDAGEYAKENCTEIATVKATTVYLRKKPDEGSESLTTLSKGESYEVIQTEDEFDGWIYIQIDSDVEGYVTADYMDISYGFAQAVSTAEEEEIRKKERDEEEARQAELAKTNTVLSVVDTTGTNIISYALQFLGNPYVYGGTSLTNGTDCSGFTMRIYEHFGYTLPRTAEQQMNATQRVDLDAIQPGDLLFYQDSSGSIGHVTMYIGGNQVVHASSSTTGIIVSNIGYRTPCAAGRVIGY